MNEHSTSIPIVEHNISLSQNDRKYIYNDSSKNPIVPFMNPSHDCPNMIVKI